MLLLQMSAAELSSQAVGDRAAREAAGLTRQSGHPVQRWHHPHFPPWQHPGFAGVCKAIPSADSVGMKDSPAPSC